MRSTPSILSLAVILGSMNAMPSAKAAESGEIAFNNRCRTCHSVREGDHRLGPSLHNIIGKKAGSSEYANYSQALRTSGLVWNEETLDKFIANPDAVISGNNMKPYAGLPDATERKQIVDYLKSKASQKK